MRTSVWGGDGLHRYGEDSVGASMWSWRYRTTEAATSSTWRAAAPGTGQSQPVRQMSQWPRQPAWLCPGLNNRSQGGSSVCKAWHPRTTLGHQPPHPFQHFASSWGPTVQPRSKGFSRRPWQAQHRPVTPREGGRQPKMGPTVGQLHRPLPTTTGRTKSANGTGRQPQGTGPDCRCWAGWGREARRAVRWPGPRQCHP